MNSKQHPRNRALTGLLAAGMMGVLLNSGPLHLQFDPPPQPRAEAAPSSAPASLTVTETAIQALEDRIAAQQSELEAQRRVLHEQLGAIAWHEERVAELESKIERLEAIAQRLLADGANTSRTPPLPRIVHGLDSGSKAQHPTGQVTKSPPANGEPAEIEIVGVRQIEETVRRSEPGAIPPFGQRKRTKAPP